MSNPFFVILGAVVLLSQLCNFADVRKMTDIINKDKSGLQLTNDENKRAFGYGCSSFLAYMWLFVGFFTSGWLLCLVWLFVSMIERALNADKPVTLKYCVVSTILDILFTLMILVNEVLLHFDIAEYFRNQLI